jgi:tRNA(Ile)-lysidine synthetase-like protein
MKLCISKGAQSHIIDISPEASLEFLYDVASQVLDQQCLQLKTGFPLLSLERSTTTTIQSVLHDNDRVTAVTDQDGESVSILNHCRAIRSILDFWFGQYSPDMAQKRLWMIASSSVEHRRKIDKEITSRFKEIVANDQIHEWLSEIFGYQGKIAAIVALDQFSRHIHRYLKEVGNGSFPEQSILDARALAAANIFVDEHENEISCGMIPLPMVVFAIMPFRHTNTLDALQVVQHRVEQLAAIEMQHESMLRRFRKATNRRVALLQDESRRSGSGNSKSSFSENDILEAFHFDADMCSAKEHIVVRSIVQFLADRGIHPDADAIGNRYPIIVSLSGGVDSMVIISVLAYLATQCHFHIHVCAVHIDYANRPESEAEAVFVKNYCEERHVRFFLRRIDEVTRGVTERNEYERVARDARYSSYREAVQVCRHEYGDSSIKVGVFLGHHKGDIRENVLSNAHKGCGPLDLSGMTSESTNDGVVIYRPLLSLEKGDIFDFAHKFGVPYFKVCISL